MGREGGLPGWLGGLVEETFFVGCGTHDTMKKNEKNIFCLDCCTSICPHCATSHPSHPLLQVRRYVYNDVVRLDDLEKLIDCSFVQPYTINSAKVIFLKPRPQSRPFKGSGNICLSCDRILQEPFHYCCLTCKVEHVVMQGADLSSILFRFDESDFAFAHFESLRMDGPDLLDDDPAPGGGQITPNSILEDPLQYKGSSGGSSADGGRGGASGRNDAAKRKKGGGSGGGAAGGGRGFFPGIVLSLGSRRKGAPHRAPLS
ncbi:hypothetical protein AXF42_Ash015552 [Apostasia shenzhenica]|uniref:B box-type domain-containing protein n=1 Tax=Apostasia shenzhenica TaxID=1088818 RepID=A0A2I0AKJ6_9ASPA|nr:hypothetical protein AXF42_Ash015552 [Apostasia shenzhenica]